MAGSGNYVRPSTRIQQMLAKLYEEEKPLIEVGGILLVFAALLLNLQASESFAGQCLRLLQFFSLIGSLVILLRLLLGVAFSYMQPWNEWIEREKRLRITTEVSAMFKLISIALFFVTTFLLFLISLFFFVITIFPRESMFTTMIAACYAFTYFCAGKLSSVEFKYRPVVLAVMTFMLIVIPVGLAIELLFPNIYKDIYTSMHT